MPFESYEGKVDFVKLLMREYSLGQEECAFVGDGGNDVRIAREVGASFCCGHNPELKKVATRVLRARYPH